MCCHDKDKHEHEHSHEGCTHSHDGQEHSMRPALTPTSIPTKTGTISTTQVLPLTASQVANLSHEGRIRLNPERAFVAFPSPDFPEIIAFHKSRWRS